MNEMALPERLDKATELRFSPEEVLARCKAVLASDRRIIVGYIFDQGGENDGSSGDKDRLRSGASPSTSPEPVEPVRAPVRRSAHQRPADHRPAMAIATDGGFREKDFDIVAEALRNELYSDNAVIVWLNRADPATAFVPIRNGKTVYYRDGDSLNDFEHRTKKRYYDYRARARRQRRGAAGLLGNGSDGLGDGSDGL